MSSRRSSTATRRTATAASIGAVAVLAALFLTWWLRSSVELPAAAAAAGVAPAPIAEPAVAWSARPGRVEVVAEGVPAPVQDGPTKARSFDEIFSAIVELWRERPTDDGSAHAAATGELLTELLVTFPDAGERTLLRIAAMPTPWGAIEASSQVTGRIGRVALGFALQRLAAEADLTPRLAPLLAMLLDSMPGSAEMAGFVADVLADKPYLGADNEPALIELARQASGSLAFMAEPVRRLLLTAWANVGQAGGDLAIADLLAWFGDPEAGVLREAAMHRLLASDRYRDLVLDQLIAEKDLVGIEQAALHVVQKLPFRTAIGVLSRLRSANVHTDLIFPYTWMATANSVAMRTDYEECLADNLMPRHRESLIVAIGNERSGGSSATAAALTAFDMDPDPRVRGAAFLALCNQGPTQVVSDCLTVAMADRDFAAKYDLSYMVNGVRSLAQREDRDVNLIELVTRFLLSQSTLSSADRERLETVRREYLPR